MSTEAQHYEKLDDGRVRCRLCPHECPIPPGKAGLCRVRVNEAGTLIAMTFGMASSVAMDPIEKKPLYHFHPGTSILSIGTAGCTFHCKFCQNWQLLDPAVPQQPLPPEAAVQLAASRGSIGIAYTYNEPYASFEYVLATARLAREAGLKNVLVTNGYYMPGPFEELGELVDAMNIDLKSMSDEFYRTYCRGRLEPVLRTIRTAVERGIHVELTNLLIPGLNDSAADISAWVDFVAGVRDDIPVHFSRYRPAHEMDRPPTPVASLELARRLAARKLKFVYLGNVVSSEGSASVCPSCGATLVERLGYSTSIVKLQGNRCGGCGEKLNFVA